MKTRKSEHTKGEKNNRVISPCFVLRLTAPLKCGPAASENNRKHTIIILGTPPPTPRHKKSEPLSYRHHSCVACGYVKDQSPPPPKTKRERHPYIRIQWKATK